MLGHQHCVSEGRSHCFAGDMLASQRDLCSRGMALQDWKDKLSKDPQKRADPKVFQHSELRELFGAYVHNLRGQIQQGYRSLMDQASNSIMQLLCSTKSFIGSCGAPPAVVC